MAAHNLVEGNYISSFEISRKIYVYDVIERGIPINYHIPQHPDPSLLSYRFQVSLSKKKKQENNYNHLFGSHFY